jgi:hypothetical protein
MPDSPQKIILEELRALRSDFNTFARDTGERVSVLKTDVHSRRFQGQSISPPMMPPATVTSYTMDRSAALPRRLRSPGASPRSREAHCFSRMLHMHSTPSSIWSRYR